MHLPADTSPFGTLAPKALDRAVLALTRRLPDNWFGLRLAMLLRRITTARLGMGALDVDNFALKLRLYPIGNNCEKGALFTPQMYEASERRVLSRLVEHALAEGRAFVFVDVGANVGLFSLIVARMAGGRIRALALEPQPGIRDRLAYNLACNPEFDIRPLGIAVTDREGEVNLFVDLRDRGGTRVGGRGEQQSVCVRSRRLDAVLTEEGFNRADVIKIDIEGAEDIVLAPFLRDVADEQLPHTFLIEDSRNMWTHDLFAMLAARGYQQGERSRLNIFFHRGRS